MRPVLAYDGQCGFCKLWVERWRETHADALELTPYQQLGERFPHLSQSEMGEAIHLIEAERVYRGAHAIFRAASYGSTATGWLLWAYHWVPFFARVAEWGYAQVAAHRGWAMRVTRVLVGPSVKHRRYVLSRWLFFRALALIHIFAFGSLLAQLGGLVGPDGIAPATTLLRTVANDSGDGHPFWRLPTLFWWTGADAAVLYGGAVAGLLLATLLLLGWGGGIALLGMWALYASYVAIGDVFFSYQWDALLLEVSLVALFWVPWWPWPRAWRRAPNVWGAWLLRLVLFKLIWLSGVVKLASGDPSWANGTALQFHYWTQPLPAWTSYYAQILPDAVHRVAWAVMFCIELGFPWLILGTRKMQYLAAGGFALLQVLIGLTGNYGFFNLLALALCIPLVDDRAWHRLLPRFVRSRVDWVPLHAVQHTQAVAVGWRWTGRLLAALVAVVIVGKIWEGTFGGRLPGLHTLSAPLESVRSANTYGLFAVMTTRRPEIRVQGSNDGENWRTYRFAYKPGPPSRAPRFVQPHMPRLDWQMWFAALGRCQRNPWFHRFMRELLEGSQPVLALLAHNPFPKAPPKYIRSRLHEYRFAYDDGGRWWRTQPRRAYCPAVKLGAGGALRVASEL